MLTTASLATAACKWLLTTPVVENGYFVFSLKDDDLTTEKVKIIVKKFFLGENWRYLCARCIRRRRGGHVRLLVSSLFSVIFMLEGFIIFLCIMGIFMVKGVLGKKWITKVKYCLKEKKRL